MSDPTAAEPLYYESIGLCIYCGRTAEAIGEALTDEHIVPYALNGGWVFRAASCNKCARTINTYESICGRDLFGNFRIRYRLQTRNPEQRPLTIPIAISEGGEEKTRNVPRADFPAPFLFFKFAEAGILGGKSKTLCKFEPIPIMICDGPEIESYKKAHPEWNGAFKIRSCQLELARMLAKIGHGHAVAMLKWNTFTPLLQNIILCKTNKVAYLVGGESDIPESVPGKEHSLSMYFKVMSSQRVLIVVNIRLFGQISGTPVFHVVAGEFDPANSKHLATFTECLKFSELVTSA